MKKKEVWRYLEPSDPHLKRINHKIRLLQHEIAILKQAREVYLADMQGVTITFTETGEKIYLKGDDDDEEDDLPCNKGYDCGIADSFPVYSIGLF